MTKSEALNTLMKMRAWRRWGKGEQNEKDRPEMPEQKEVDDAFDVCIEMLSKSSLPSNLDEAANNYGIDIRLGYPRVMDETDRYIYNAFKAGAEWMAGQGATMEITDDTKWADLDSFVHKKVTGGSIIQIRKK